MKRKPGRPGVPRSRPEAKYLPTDSPEAERATREPERVPHWWGDTEDNFAPGLYFDDEGKAHTRPPKK
jgi:hypothetical protein